MNKCGGKKKKPLYFNTQTNSYWPDSDAELPVCETRLACDVRK